jgi:hypothetical protein
MIRLKGNTFACTDGTGHWSREVRDVRLTKLTVPYINEEEDFAELRVYFDEITWKVDTHGLIYTDRKFRNELRLLLVKVLQFTEAAALDVCYSEQGMQGDDYVSFDVDKLFLDEWLAIPHNTDHL